MKSILSTTMQQMAISRYSPETRDFIRYARELRTTTRFFFYGGIPARELRAADGHGQLDVVWCFDHTFDFAPRRAQKDKQKTAGIDHAVSQF